MKQRRMTTLCCILVLVLAAGTLYLGGCIGRSRISPAASDENSEIDQWLEETAREAEQFLESSRTTMEALSETMAAEAAAEQRSYFMYDGTLWNGDSPFETETALAEALKNVFAYLPGATVVYDGSAELPEIQVDYALQEFDGANYADVNLVWNHEDGWFVSANNYCMDGI